MSKQIAIRLAEDLVEYIDEIVARDEASSRAVVVATSLKRDRRRAIAARDAEILSRTGPDPELAGLAEFAAGLEMDA